MYMYACPVLTCVNMIIIVYTYTGQYNCTLPVLCVNKVNGWGFNVHSNFFFFGSKSILVGRPKSIARC